MFYESRPDTDLRLGDMVQGFPILYSLLRKPPLSLQEAAYQVEVDIPEYAVILTPCCSIRDRIISVCPLKRLDKQLFKSPYLKEDFTRVNHRMRRVRAIPPDRLHKMSEEDITRMESEAEQYGFLTYFIYEPHELLRGYTYTISKQEVAVAHYMIDFRDTFKVECTSLPEEKVLQLSICSRTALREKLAEYYGRIPEEDGMDAAI